MPLSKIPANQTIPTRVSLARRAKLKPECVGPSMIPISRYKGPSLIVKTGVSLCIEISLLILLMILSSLPATRTRCCFPAVQSDSGSGGSLHFRNIRRSFTKLITCGSEAGQKQGQNPIAKLTLPVYVCELVSNREKVTGDDMD